MCLDLLRSRRSRREDPIGDREPVDGGDPARDALLAASRGGDFEALLVVLDPSVVLRADRVTVAAAQASPGAPALADEVRGRDAVAAAFRGRAQGARLALVDGAVGAVWAVAGHVRAAFLFTVVEDRIAGVRITSDPARLAELEIDFL